MIYQPRHVYPSAAAIDGTQNNVFTMEMQTNDVVSAYKLSILDFNNNEIYVGSTQTLETPLYNGETLAIAVLSNETNMVNGLNYKWRVRLYQPTFDMLITYGNVQGATSTTQLVVQQNINIRVGMILNVNGEQRAISSYDLSTGEVVVSSAFTSLPSTGDKYYVYSNFIDTIPDYIVYARATPTVSISNVPVDLALKYHTFTGVYTQTNNVPMIYHTFNLYLVNNDNTKTLIDSSGKVYSANLSYTYNNFRTGNTYAIEMIVENNVGIVSQTELYTFDVSYNIIEYPEQPTAAFNNQQNAVKVSWATPVEHDGKITDIRTGREVGAEYLYNTPYNSVNSLYTSGVTAEWQSNDGICTMPDDYNITFQFSPDSNFFYDNEGHYTEEVEVFSGEGDGIGGAGNFVVSVNKNKLIFEQEPSTSLEATFYSNTTQVFCLTETGIKQNTEDYIWDDEATWNDNYIWTEGGTSLERVCNHWWKVQITNSAIQIEELFLGN